MIDIICELDDFGVHVQVADPLADPRKVREVYGLELMPVDALKLADAVVLAVPHQAYVEMGWNGICPLLNSDRGIVAVKNASDVKRCPNGIKLWRL